jgi:hypothetical protein
MPEVLTVEPLTAALGRTAWSEPDAVFADLFSMAGLPDLDPAEVCSCPDCQAEESGPSLPVLRPQPDQALVAMAAASPLLARACALARWLGPGRALTPAKVLRPADAAVAVAEVGLDRPVLPADGTFDARPFGRAVGSKGSRAKSAKHLPALHPIWSAAVAGGLIEVRGQRAKPGRDLELWSETSTDAVDAADVHQRLNSWARMVAAYLRAQAEIEEADELWFAGPQQLLLPMSALLLYTSHDDTPITPATLAVGALVAAEEDDEIDPMLLLTLPEQVARWNETLQVWATMGVITQATDVVDIREGEDVVASPAIQEWAEGLEALIADMRDVFSDRQPLLEPLLAAVQQGPLVTVTPPGRDLLARVLRGQGLSVPTVGDLADSPPGEFLLALAGHDPAAAGDEIRIWLDARGQEWPAALHDLVTSASGPDDQGPLRRTVLPLVIAVVFEAADSMIPQWQQDPWLAVPVGLALAATSQARRPATEHLLWMAVDMLSMDLDDDDAFAELIDATGVADQLAAPGAIAVAVGLKHPRTRQVLGLLIEHLQDRALARQLKRALAQTQPKRTPKRHPAVAPLPGL